MSERKDIQQNELLTVPQEMDGQRLDTALFKLGAYRSRSLASKYCANKKVLVNGTPRVKNYRVVPGDKIEFEPAPEKTGLQAENIPLDIRFEDEHIIVLSKQPGLVCHPAPGHESSTLVNALIAHCGKENLCNIQGDETRLGIVHRLDADTSGLMIVAKTDKAGEKLSHDMKMHTTSRHYLALVNGYVKQNTGKIIAPLLRSATGRPKMVVKDDPKAKDAVTTFETLTRYVPAEKTPAGRKKDYGNGLALLDCKIHTGRTHQIRSHMEFINHPVVGDKLYNAGLSEDNKLSEILGLRRQFLHSYRIGFVHPVFGTEMSFNDKLPKDLQSALDIVEADLAKEEKDKPVLD